MASSTTSTPKKEKFIEALRSTGNISKAAKLVKIDRKTVYNWKEADTAFSKQWEKALDEASDLLEDEAKRRAYEGVKKPIYQGGKRVGFVKEYSDTLLIFLLKGAKPEKYRERFEHTGKDGKDLIPDVKTLIEKVYGDGDKASK